MEIAITRMSSKGQVVIPANMRQNMSEGDEFVLIKEKDKIIIKKMDELKEKLKEDVIFAERVDKAWQAYDRGEFKTTTLEDFKKELEKC